jgi:hypothetical protein
MGFLFGLLCLFALLLTLWRRGYNRRQLERQKTEELPEEPYMKVLRDNEAQVGIMRANNIRMEKLIQKLNSNGKEPSEETQ